MVVQGTQNILIGHAQKRSTIEQGHHQLQSSLACLMQSHTTLQTGKSRTTYTSVTMHQQVTPRLSSACRCRCHRKSPTLSLENRFLGSLFIGYSNVPFLTGKCSSDLCQARCKLRSTQVSVTYYFPALIFSKSIHAAFISDPSCGPSLGLTVRDIVSIDSPWFYHACNGNLDELKSLLESGSAQVNDIDSGSAWTALHASLSKVRWAA